VIYREVIPQKLPSQIVIGRRQQEHPNSEAQNTYEPEIMLPAEVLVLASRPVKTICHWNVEQSSYGGAKIANPKKRCSDACSEGDGFDILHCLLRS
jgi:hypothetical protein